MSTTPCLFVILFSVLSDVYAVQCYNYTLYECTESRARESALCMELAELNKRSTQECHYLQDSCYQIAGEVKVSGATVNVKLGGCSTEMNLRDCYSRSKLHSVDPSLAMSLEEIEQSTGFYYENREVCYCYGDFCNAGIPLHLVSCGVMTLLVFVALLYIFGVAKM